jgi:hypothetical protein
LHWSTNYIPTLLYSSYLHSKLGKDK